MEPYAVRNESPIKACHNCRRSRRRCDRSIPTCIKCHSTGQVCLGYGKLLHWTNSIASRGNMMGKTFTANRASKTHPMTPCAYSTSLVKRSESASSHEDQSISSPGSASSWCRQLGDPIFQDLSSSSRVYLVYYDRQVCKDLVIHDLPHQNPFRDLLSLSVNYPLLQHIIVANSALHLANATKKGALARDDRRGPSAEAYKDALIAKHKALRLLPEALTNRDTMNSDVVLASIMLFIKFELLDSGANEWRFHTEGARQLMAYLRESGKLESAALNSLRNCLISNCAVYDIIGTTLTGSSMESGMNGDLFDIASTNIKEQANSCLSCPPLLLQVIRDVSRSCRASSPENLPMKRNNQLLSIVDAFNPLTWADSLQHVSLSFDLEMRAHIGSAYKAAVKIYILRASVLAKPASINPEPLEDLVSEIVHHLMCIPPNDPFFKATCWPSFIAGAETNDPDTRAWVSSRFETALQTMPWGYMSSAVDLLHRVWAHKCQKEGGIDWLINLKSSENDWLIA